MGRAPPLGAHLHYPIVLASRGNHRLPLGHVHADGLLNVHVGSGLDRGDGGQSMPVIGRAHDDDIQVLSRQHLPIIGERPRLLPGGLPGGGHLGGLGQHLPVHVAERDNLHGGNLDEPEEVTLAVPSRADQAHTFGLCLESTRAPARSAGEGQFRSGNRS